ncbi:hypothetical protein Droror1_Dr00006746 [Drosera rotundifolia]
MNRLTQTLARSTTPLTSPHIRSLLSFSTRITTSRRPKPLPPPPPPLQTPPELFAAVTEVVEKVEMVFNRPKPTLIPFQTKVANAVNLIGTVEAPVKFISLKEGKSWAGIVVSQQQYSDWEPLRIPVVFEDDLAHTAACHIKEKDNIYVSGELCAQKLPVQLEDGLGDMQVVVHEINFVDELPELTKRSVHRKQEAKAAQFIDNSGSSMKEIGGEKKGDRPASAIQCWEELLNNPKDWFDYRNDKLAGAVNPKYPDFKKVEGGQPLWLSTLPKWLAPKLEGLEFSTTPPKETKVGGGFGNSFFKKKPVVVSKDAPKTWNEAKTGSGAWKDVLENPDKWWDNRSRKHSAKFPDFKHKDTGEVLWLDKAPQWVLLKLPEPKTMGSFGNRKETLLS